VGFNHCFLKLVVRALDNAGNFADPESLIAHIERKKLGQGEKRE